jgi:hypothetical protein
LEATEALASDPEDTLWTPVEDPIIDFFQLQSTVWVPIDDPTRRFFHLRRVE